MEFHSTWVRVYWLLIIDCLKSFIRLSPDFRLHEAASVRIQNQTDWSSFAGPFCPSRPPSDSRFSIQLTAAEKRNQQELRDGPRLVPAHIRPGSDRRKVKKPQSHIFISFLFQDSFINELIHSFIYYWWIVSSFFLFSLLKLNRKYSADEIFLIKVSGFIQDVFEARSDFSLNQLHLNKQLSSCDFFFSDQFIQSCSVYRSVINKTTQTSVL